MEYIGRDERDALAILVHVRHRCFQRGVLGNYKKGAKEHPEDDFKLAFRVVNRLYVQLRAQKSRVDRSERRSQ